MNPTEIFNKILSDAGLECLPDDVKVVGVEHWDSANWGDEEDVEDGNVSVCLMVPNPPSVRKNSTKSQKAFDIWNDLYNMKTRGILISSEAAKAFGCCSIHPNLIYFQHYTPKDFNTRLNFEDWFTNWPSNVKKRDDQLLKDLIRAVSNADKETLRTLTLMGLLNKTGL